MSAAAGVAGALLALAAALVVAPGPVTARHRTVPRSATRGPAREGLVPGLALVAAGLVAGVIGAGLAALLGVVGGVAVVVLLPRWRARRARPRPDPLALAGAWDQLAACLRAGLPLDRAARAVVPALPDAAGQALGRVADLVALGSDPAAAWAPALEEPDTVRLARAARRSSRSGAAVADVVEAVAADLRAEAVDAVEARAERAGVLVTGPLGLCFLPAFLALGIVPVVVGLAGPLLEQR
ncbi:type II secretion system F family protein [Actinomycetospora straminea]|uniref:Type II secretion system protein GspF domain-containing protein n=1 Tax=Actinomycetospora straminea TaxID=663607 RepID=A0ABP9ED12_9PSEU|nr:type II secretion system F family protein [Actinomycetospora straminea]MDD7934312.1 type II secretion system F family protein [Actinomycetospora straminea]